MANSQNSKDGDNGNGKDVEDAAVRQKLEREKEELQQRLEFVEELVGPTEAQRKQLHEQVLAARSAALRAKYRGAKVPTKVTGRLDEQLLASHGLSERDAGLLQGGCIPDTDGILQDVSLLGDPDFRPYDERTGETRWHARGGMLQLSLGEVRGHFGDTVAEDVVRCSKELDKYDASRRVGIELPWHHTEDRELEPAEVINMMDRELSVQNNLLYLEKREGLRGEGSHEVSPYSVVNVPAHRGRGRRGRGRPSLVPQTARGPRSGTAGVSERAGAVVALPRMEAPRRAAPDPRCALPGLLRSRAHSADQSWLGRLTDRIRPS